MRNRTTSKRCFSFSNSVLLLLLFGIISFEGLNLGLELNLYYSIEVLEDLANLRFSFIRTSQS